MRASRAFALAVLVCGAAAGVVDPVLLAARDALGKIRAGDTRGAESTLARAARDHPRDPRAVGALASFYAHTGRWSQVLEATEYVHADAWDLRVDPGRVRQYAEDALRRLDSVPSAECSMRDALSSGGLSQLATAAHLVGALRCRLAVGGDIDSVLLAAVNSVAKSCPPSHEETVCDVGPGRAGRNWSAEPLEAAEELVKRRTPCRDLVAALTRTTGLALRTSPAQVSRAVLDAVGMMAIQQGEALPSSS